MGEEGEGVAEEGGIPEMCLAPRLLSPEQARDSRRLIQGALWPGGAEVGPPNLLQVERSRKKGDCDQKM